jgi:WD40 repeat protein
LPSHAATLELVSEKANAHSSYVMSVQFSPDGTKIVSGSSDKTIKVWELISWSRQAHMLFNATTRTRAVSLFLLLLLKMQSMELPEDHDVLELLIRASL